MSITPGPRPGPARAAGEVPAAPARDAGRAQGPPDRAVRDAVPDRHDDVRDLHGHDARPAARATCRSRWSARAPTPSGSRTGSRTGPTTRSTSASSTTCAEAEELIRDQEIAGAIEIPPTRPVGDRPPRDGRRRLAGDRWSTSCSAPPRSPVVAGRDQRRRAAARGRRHGHHGAVRRDGHDAGRLRAAERACSWARRTCCGSGASCPLAIGWGAFTSSLVWLILGPLVGAVDGHYPLFLGVGTLAVTAVGMAQLLFTKVLGPFAVLLGMLLWVDLRRPVVEPRPVGAHDAGVPPVAARRPPAARGRRGAALGDLLRRRRLLGPRPHPRGVARRRRSPSRSSRSAAPVTSSSAVRSTPSPTRRCPALSGGPVAPYRRRLVAVALFPLAIVVTVVTLMSLSMHEPEIARHAGRRGRPGRPGRAGSSTASSRSSASYLDLRVVDSADEATDLVRSQELVAAYVLPTTRGRRADPGHRRRRRRQPAVGRARRCSARWPPARSRAGASTTSPR